MFSMNTLIRTHHVVDLKEELEYFSEIGYNLNLDALWKWASIWNVVKQLELLDNPFKCIDVGGGLSPLHFIFSNYGEVTNVEISGFRSTWFPVNHDGLYIDSPGIKHNRKNIHYVQEDFYTFIKRIPDNSIDFIYDGCSLIHFNTQKRHCHNDGVFYAMKEITRALRPGGYFVSASHVAHPDAIEAQCMIHPHHLGECFTRSGMMYVGEVDWNLEPFFRDRRNMHYPDPDVQSSGRAYLKNTPLACTKCKGLPDYHCLYEAHLKGTTVIDCLYTLWNVDALENK